MGANEEGKVVAAEIVPIKIKRAISFTPHLEQIHHYYSIGQLLNILASSNFIEVREACARQIGTLSGMKRGWFEKETLIKWEEVITQLLRLYPDDNVAKQLLSAYVFCGSNEVAVRAIKFALSFALNSFTVKYQYRYLGTVSKIVCGCLNDYCPSESNIYAEFTDLEEFLMEVINESFIPHEGGISRDNPQVIKDFFMAERALKVIVRYPKHSQKFLPLLHAWLKLHEMGHLIIRPSSGDSVFDVAKNLAVLKESARILSEAKSEV